MKTKETINNMKTKNKTISMKTKETTNKTKKELMPEEEFRVLIQGMTFKNYNKFAKDYNKDPLNKYRLISSREHIKRVYGMRFREIKKKELMPEDKLREFIKEKSDKEYNKLTSNYNNDPLNEYRLVNSSRFKRTYGKTFGEIKKGVEKEYMPEEELKEFIIKNNLVCTSYTSLIKDFNNDAQNRYKLTYIEFFKDIYGKSFSEIKDGIKKQTMPEKMLGDFIRKNNLTTESYNKLVNSYNSNPLNTYRIYSVRSLVTIYGKTFNEIKDIKKRIYIRGGVK